MRPPGVYCATCTLGSMQMRGTELLLKVSYENYLARVARERERGVDYMDPMGCCCSGSRILFFFL